MSEQEAKQPRGILKNKLAAPVTDAFVDTASTTAKNTLANGGLKADHHNGTNGSSAGPDDDKNITWDEEAITAYDKLRGQTQKITEPKTPFINYDSANDRVLGISMDVPPMELAGAFDESDLPPLKLADGSVLVQQSASSETASNGSAKRKPESETVSSNASPTSLGSESAKRVDKGVDAPSGETKSLEVKKDPAEWDSDDDEDYVNGQNDDDDEEDKFENDEERAKHEKFEKMRHQHYDMKNALAMGKQMLDDDEADDDE